MMHIYNVNDSLRINTDRAMVMVYVTCYYFLSVMGQLVDSNETSGSNYAIRVFGGLYPHVCVDD